LLTTHTGAAACYFRFLEPAQSPPFHWAGPTCHSRRLYYSGQSTGMAELVEAAFDAEWEQVEVRRPLEAVDLEPSL